MERNPWIRQPIRMGRSKHRRNPSPRPEPRRIEVDPKELASILEETRSMLAPPRFEKLQGAVDTLVFLTAELERVNRLMK
jgi:hypothetical protein